MNQKLYNAIIDLGVELKIPSIKVANKFITYSSVLDDICEISLNIINNENLKPSNLPGDVLKMICVKKEDELKVYYNKLSEKDKVKLLSKLNNFTIVFPDRVVTSRYFTCGSPADYCHRIIHYGINNSYDKEHAALVKDAAFFFKYINFSMFQRKYYNNESFFTNINKCVKSANKINKNHALLDLIERRLNFYSERKISKDDLKVLFNLINNVNVNKVVRDYIMKIVEKNIPEKILLDITL